jgi:hypothetical protein
MFAGESSKWNGIQVSPSETFFPTRAVAVIRPLLLLTAMLKESGDPEPELLFICYFDKKLLKEQGDVAHKARDTEKAIVKNIEGKVTGFFPSKTAYTYYGSTYKYYLGKYSDPAQLGRGYHTEYVFQEDGDRGIIVLLYVYREEKHLSDVMFAARFIETR